MSSTRRDARVGGAQQAWIKLPLAVLLLSASSMWIATVNGAPAKFDPIAVALPNNAQTATATSTSTATTTNNAHAPTSTTFTTTVDPTSSVEIEQANLVKLNSIQRQQQQQQQQEASEPAPQVLAVDAALPDYLLALNDPDIAGPVAWTPAPNGEALKVIAWDLLPPHKEATSAVPEDQQQASQEPTIITHDHQAPPKRVQGVEDPVTHNIRLSLSTGNAGLGQISGLRAQAGQVSVVDIGSGSSGIESEAEAETERETHGHGHGTNAHVGSTTPSSTNRFPIRNRGTVHYSTTTTTPRTTTTTQATTTTTTTTTTRRPTTTTTTTTKRPTTTTTTTTTRRPTTTRATTTTTTTTAPLDSAYKLPNEEEYAYTLPPWLSGVTDPDLDVAVTFIVPEDNDKYNHTLERDLEPPLEPFVDVKDIQLTPPPTLITSVTAKPKTTAATTTRTPTTTTTTITTSTTRRPTAATTRAYWVRASPTTPTASTFIPSTLNAAPENGEPNILSSRINTNNLAPNHIQTFAHKPKTSSTTATATTLSSTQSSTIPPTQAATPSQVSTVFNTGKWQHPIKSNIATTASTTDTDPITSAEAATGEHNGKPQASRNPFLPKPFERQPATVTPTTPRTTTTTARTTTTTTTTTTPASVEVYKNPFDSATIPPWLLDFDYADVGPGVPYDPNNFRDDNRDNSNNNNNNPILTFKPLQTPQGFSHQTTSITPSSSTSTSITPNTNTATSTTAFSSSFGNAPRVTATSSASPSKVTLSLPSINQQAPVDDNNGQPPLVLIPPADNVETSNDNGNSNQYQPLSLSSRGTLTTSTKTTATTLNAQQPNPSISSTNTNFAAQLESQGEANPSPLSVSGESFPPFQGNDVNIPTATQKFEYTKSDEGKVITTPVQAQGKDTLTNSVFNSGIEASSGSGSTFGISQTSFSSAAAPTSSSTSTTASVFGSGQVGSSSSSISASGKYTGGFGGPPGLLRPKQTSASTQTPIWVAGDANDYSKTGAKSTLKPTIQGKYTGGFGAPAGVVAPNDRPFIPYRNNQQAGRFGGPPGVLVPFDNVQGGGQ